VIKLVLCVHSIAHVSLRRYVYSCDKAYYCYCNIFSGAGTVESGGHMTPEIYLGVKHGILTPDFLKEIFPGTQVD